MSDQRICTIEQFSAVLKKTVSERRFIHSMGVAQTTCMLLDYYGCTDYEKTWNGFEAGYFCGLAHDLCREMPGPVLIEYCRKNGVHLTQWEIESPVLAHGKASAFMAGQLVPGYPESWKRAIEAHTTGLNGLDDLAQALFVADFIEPSRTFLTEEKRREYLANPSLTACEYAILCDMIAHWKEKGYHDASEGSLLLKRELEEKLEI